jgi:hypothetical protein
MQGLIPRATELAKLGGSFWVSFYPFIGVVIAAFVVLYLVSTGVTTATGVATATAAIPPACQLH